MPDLHQIMVRLEKLDLDWLDHRRSALTISEGRAVSRAEYVRRCVLDARKRSENE